MGNNNDKNETSNILITYYWERVQLYIEGHSEGVDLTSGQFCSEEFNQNKTLEANEMKIDGNTFHVDSMSQY